MHWQNSNFQIAHFLAGKCHTADEAFRVLRQQLEDREVALATAARFSWRKLWREFLLLFMKPDALDLQARACIDQAQREAAYIRSLLAQIEPARKLAHLPDHLAYQFAQQEEWRRELIYRAENYIASLGAIPPEQLATMRLHPEFKDMIAPRIQKMLAAQKSGQLSIEGKTKLLPEENKPKLVSVNE